MPEREWSRPTAPTSQFPSFDQLDANRDGVITREEWSAGFGKAPPVDEQERLERNLAALAATVTAPATRRSPDYTSATFETFERGAFSDTFERGTVALPPSGAAETAINDLRAQRDESLKLHVELQEVRGALEAERSITKRLTAQLHTTAARQAQASADRTAEEGAIQRAADSRQLAEQGRPTRCARATTRSSGWRRRSRRSRRRTPSTTRRSRRRAPRRTPLAAATREREAALATARLEREGALVAAQQRVDELLKVVETQEGAHAREATALRAHGERSASRTRAAHADLDAEEHGDPATLRAELAGARAAQQQAHHAALAAESKAADAIANERGLILAGGDQAALRARAEAAERAAASEATVAHLRTEVAAARGGGGGGYGGGGGGEAVNAAERRAAAAEARASRGGAAHRRVAPGADNQAAAGLSAPSPSFGISGFGAGGGELGREAAAEDLQAFASKLSVAARAARRGRRRGATTSLASRRGRWSLPAEDLGGGGAGAIRRRGRRGTRRRRRRRRRARRRGRRWKRASIASLRRGGGGGGGAAPSTRRDGARALPERQEAEGLRAEAARYRAAEYSEDNTAATAAARAATRSSVTSAASSRRRSAAATRRGGSATRCAGSSSRRAERSSRRRRTVGGWWWRRRRVAVSSAATRRGGSRKRRSGGVRRRRR